jgi:hypothetical protein
LAQEKAVREYCFLEVSVEGLIGGYSLKAVTSDQ